MKLYYFKFIFLVLCKISLVLLAEYKPNPNKRYLRNIFKEKMINSSNSLENNDLIIDENSKNIEKEKFNFDNVLLNLRIIENKIKSFKNKLECKTNKLFLINKN